jgi:trimethylamine--corrinoid protein Co-methyltransferase
VNLYESTPQIDASGYLLCIAHDIAESTRHITMAEAHLNLSQKPMMGTVLSPVALKEVAELTNATEFIVGQCKLLHMINSTPPLTYQTNPLQCLRQASLLGQGCTVSSYMMMGATSPVSVKVSLAQGLAEILIGLALTQLYQPGTCVVGGLFAAEFSMSKMLPAFGTVESQLVQMAGIQLIKRIGVPCRGDGFVTSAKIVDEQANAEGTGIMSASLNAGADLLLHTAGWLENGRCIDIKKIELDLTLLQKV